MFEEQMWKLVSATNKASWAYNRTTFQASLEIHTEKGKVHRINAVYFTKAPPIGRNSYFPYKMYNIQNLSYRGGGAAIQVWVDPSDGKLLDEIGNTHEMLPYFTAVLKHRVGGKHVWVARINDAFLVEQLPPDKGMQRFKFFGLRIDDLVPDAREERNASLLKMIKL